MTGRVLTTMVVAAVTGWYCTGQRLWAQPGGHDHHAHPAGQHEPAAGPGADRVPLVQEAPHGGQVTATKFQYFEAVYLPRQTRLYLYGPDQRPVSASGVRGEVVMQLRQSKQAYRFRLRHVRPPAGPDAQDYLAADVDVSRVRDGDMTVTFQLGGLPYAQESQVSFSQTFALTRTRPEVVLAPLTGADRSGIAQQQVCPVSGGTLGAMGTPIKVLVDGQPVYLCCKGCLGKIQQNPETYLPKAGRTRGANADAAAGGQIVVTKATAADQAAIAQQRLCAVSGGKLGAMGTPIKITVNGQPVFVCCQGCVGRVKQNPDHYLAKAAQLRAGR